MADRDKQTEVRSVSDLLDEIENVTLYLALATVDRRTLQIVLLKMQGYSTIDLESYRNEARESMSIKLEDSDSEVAPVPTGKVGHIIEPEMGILCCLFQGIIGSLSFGFAGFRAAYQGFFEIINHFV